MAWTWSNLDEALDAYLATSPSEEQRLAVLRALVNLVEHADVITGDPMPGERAPIRRVVVDGVEIVFVRAEEFRTLRLLAIRPAR